MPSSSEASSLVALIQKCTSVASRKQARQVHALILTTMTVISHSPYLYNNVLSMYARCGSAGDAHKVFEKMPQRNVVSYNALIAAYSRSPDHAVSALKLSFGMGVECLRPNGSSFTSLFQASSVVEDRLFGSLLHAQVVRYGFLKDQRVQTSLLGMYSNCGDLYSARKVFGWLDDKDVIAWNSIIFGNLKNCEVKEGLDLFASMMQSGVVPTHFTYSMVLNACSSLGDYRLGRVIHARVLVSNGQADLALQNALLDMYCNCGDAEEAFGVFRRMERTDLVSWNSMISGFTENGDGEKAMDLFVQLTGMALLKPDQYTFAAIISATAAYIYSDYGKPLHAQVIKVGLEKSVFVGTKLVSMYFKNGEVEAAQKVFYSISEKDVVLWTEMISSHSRLAEGNNAIEFYNEMCREGYKVDSFSLSGALSSCANLAILKQGEMIHSQTIKTGFDVEMSVCGCLVDMYAKNGCIDSAQSIFSQALEPDLKCWNAMLGGYSHHGMAEEALKLFYEILEHGLKPDQVTFLSTLSACNHGGLLESGRFFWNYMQEMGIIPGAKHYCCMVSLLSRAGLLDEAKELITKSPVNEEKLELWRTLLSSCVINKNLRIGIHAAEQVLRLDEEDSATYILLSNLYAALGQWDGVLEMRRKIRGLILEKDPGLSWLESKSNIRVFLSGVQSNPEVFEAQMTLQRLQGNMKRRETDEFEEINYSEV
ncbi:hypothetical protein UlMin_039392 [Ulmus minor]